jgi:hypothetical protein
MYFQSKQEIESAEPQSDQLRVRYIVGSGFVDLTGLFALRAMYWAGEVPIGVEEIGRRAFDALQAQPRRSIAARTDQQNEETSRHGSRNLQSFKSRAGLKAGDGPFVSQDELERASAKRSGWVLQIVCIHCIQYN